MVTMTDGRVRRVRIVQTVLRCGKGVEVSLDEGGFGWCTTVMLEVQEPYAESYMVGCEEAFKMAGFVFFHMEGCPFYWELDPPTYEAYREGSTKISFPGLNNYNSLSTSTMDLMRKYKDSKMSTQDRAFIKAGVTDREGNLRERGALDFTEWLFNEGTVKQGAKEVKLKDLFFEQVVGPALSEEESVDED